MARDKGQFTFAANFEVKKAELLDPRGSVATKAELISKETWPYDDDTIYMKKGMRVTVEEENAVYMLVDYDKILATDYSGWLRIDAGNVVQVEVVDNLTSDAADKALSAKQGKALKEEMDKKADLDELGKIVTSQLPDYILGQVLFGGKTETLSGSNLGIRPSTAFTDKYPGISSLGPGESSMFEGVYFIVGSNVEFAGLTLNVGDWIISTGEGWEKIDNTDAVSSVADLTGAITAAALAGKLAEDGTLAKSEDLKGLLKDAAVGTYLSMTVDEETGKLESIGTSAEFGSLVLKITQADSRSKTNKDSIDSLAITVGNINLTLNGNDDDTDDIPNQLGLVGRLEAVEELIGEPTDEDKTQTMLSRLNALEELVTGGDSGEGEGDQTLLQKVNQNTLDITALETTVYGADNKSGLVKAVETLNGDSSVVGSVDYKIDQAFAWTEVE